MTPQFHSRGKATDEKQGLHKTISSHVYNSIIHNSQEVKYPKSPQQQNGNKLASTRTMEPASKRKGTCDMLRHG